MQNFVKKIPLSGEGVDKFWEMINLRTLSLGPRHIVSVLTNTYRRRKPWKNKLLLSAI